MKVSEELLQYIYDKVGTDVKPVVTTLTMIVKLRETYQDTIQCLQKLKQQHQIEIDGMQDTIRQLRLRCDHPISTFFGDPSGGTDSFHKCDICEHEW